MDVVRMRDAKIAVNVTTKKELAELEDIFRKNGQLRRCNFECNGNYQIEEIQSCWNYYTENLTFYFYECLGGYIRWGYSPIEYFIKDGYRIISLDILKAEYC